MNVGLVLKEYIDELNKSDLEITSDVAINGLLQNAFKDHGAITEEILIQEIQHRLEGLKEYNSRPPEEDAA